MKFLAVLAAFITAVAAQSIEIGAPVAGTTVESGSNITVTVNKPDTLSPSEDIAVAITINHCQEDPCEDLTEDLGDILYSGPFHPAFGAPGGDYYPFQNFTVTVPSGMRTGLAAISVSHVAFVGAGPFLLTEIKNVTVTVA